MLARVDFLGLHLVILAVKGQLNYVQIRPMVYSTKKFFILHWDPIVILKLKIRLA